MLRVSFSPAPECVDCVCWNRLFSTPPRTQEYRCSSYCYSVFVFLVFWKQRAYKRILRTEIRIRRRRSARRLHSMANLAARSVYIAYVIQIDCVALETNNI